MIKVILQISGERIVNKLYETTHCPPEEIQIPTSQKTQKQISGGLKF